MWRAKAGDRAAAIVASVGDVSVTSLQISLATFRMPLLGHAAFNGLAAIGVLLLGHPLLAALLFFGATGFDAFKQHLIRRWLAEPAPEDEAPAYRRLAVLCGARVLVYTLPTFVMAAGGGRAELMFYGLQLATLLAVAVSAGALSPIVFRGFMIPMAIEMVILTTMVFDPMAAGALALGLLVLLTVVGSIARGASTAISAWHGAYVQSVADRAAADAGREAAREAGSARANFLATMSHEIRTPLNGVMGMAQLLRRDERNPVQVERLDVLIDSGDYLLQILNDVLDTSKIDAGKLEIVTAPENIRTFLERAVAFWAPRAEERGLDLSLTFSGDPPGRLMVDALRLRQVLFNLMGNALKFTETGSVAVEVHLVALEGVSEGERVRLRLGVRDTGPGIPAAHLPTLFDRFSQAEGPQTRRTDGTGLGLAIVRELTELMGGRVGVESRMGAGSFFHLELELDMAHAEPEWDDTEDAANLPRPLAMPPLRILAVDDNAINLMVLDQLLSSLGHAVSKAPGGEAALDALADETFDVVLTDIQMPAMTGSQLLRRIRATAGPNQAAPIIALTADVTSGGRERYLDEGFTEHASKPIQLQDLLGALIRATSDPAAAEAERAA